MKPEQIDAVADQLVQHHFPEVLILVVEVIGQRVVLARKVAQTLPIPGAQDRPQGGLVLETRTAFVHAGRFCAAPTKRSMASATPSSTFDAVM